MGVSFAAFFLVTSSPFDDPRLFVPPPRRRYNRGMADGPTFTIYMRGGPLDGQWRRFHLRPDDAQPGQTILRPLGVEYGKRSGSWPWAPTVTRWAEYRIVSATAAIMVADFVGVKEHAWNPSA